jgi:hypothetical protein
MRQFTMRLAETVRYYPDSVATGTLDQLACKMQQKKDWS